MPKERGTAAKVLDVTSMTEACSSIFQLFRIWRSHQMTGGQFSCLNQIPKYNDLAQLSVSLGLHF